MSVDEENDDVLAAEALNEYLGWLTEGQANSFKALMCASNPNVLAMYSIT